MKLHEAYRNFKNSIDMDNLDIELVYVRRLGYELVDELPNIKMNNIGYYAMFWVLFGMEYITIKSLILAYRIKTGKDIDDINKDNEVTREIARATEEFNKRYCKNNHEV